MPICPNCNSLKIVKNGAAHSRNRAYAQHPLRGQNAFQAFVSSKTTTIQCDELWSFVDSKDNKQWVWLALDVKTREIVGIQIGDRDEKAARKLWNSLPPVCCQCAVAYTDFWAAYETVFPRKRHKAKAQRVRAERP